MKKSILGLLLSIAMVIMSGCGGGSDSVDTITVDNADYIVTMDKYSSVVIDIDETSINDENITYEISDKFDSQYFKINSETGVVSLKNNEFISNKNEYTLKVSSVLKKSILSSWDIVVNIPKGQFFIIEKELFYTATDGVHGVELWKSDGNEAGTVMVKDITAGSLDSEISDIVQNLNPKCNF